jgi:hypothetical protein
VIGYGAHTLGLPTREIFPGGQTGNYGHDIQGQIGNMGGWTSSGRYNDAQQARWIAEEAIRRFESRGDVSALNMTNIQYGNVESPSPFSYNGAKGMGEGGGAPLHTVSAAIQDALHGEDVIVTESFHSAPAIFERLNAPKRKKPVTVESR